MRIWLSSIKPEIKEELQKSKTATLLTVFLFWKLFLMKICYLP